MQKTALIIGASSGIGKGLAYRLHDAGYKLHLTARRETHLRDICDDIGKSCTYDVLDVTDTIHVQKLFEKWVRDFTKIDLLVISAGVGEYNPDLNYDIEKKVNDVNVNGFIALANCAFNHMKETGGGTICGISSILCLRGNADAPSYNASKAYVSNYMEGLRLKAISDQLNINIIDIRPGYVDTKMAQGDNMFWVSSVEKAAMQIYQAIAKKKAVAYISKRWRLIAWLMRILPPRLYLKLF